MLARVVRPPFAPISSLSSQRASRLRKPRLAGIAAGLAAALALAGASVSAAAQTTYTCSTATPSTNCAVNIPGGNAATTVASTLTVSGASGPVASVQVVLNGVTTSAASGNGLLAPYQSLCYTAFVLEDPQHNKLALLGGTGNETCTDAMNGVTITIGGSSTPAPPHNVGGNAGAWPSTGSMTVEPSSYWNEFGISPPYDSTVTDLPQTDGTATLAKFTGEQANGTWTLHVADSDSLINQPADTDPVSITGWQLIVTYSTLPAPVVSLNSSLNPSYTSGANSAVTLTASVTGTNGTVNGGTVSFTANGSSISGCASQVVSNGAAFCTTTFSNEGKYSVQASYSGNGSTYGPSGSSNAVNQLAINHTTNPSGNTYCNTGNISTTGSTLANTIYPSYIQVPGTVTQSVGSVSVSLNGFQSTDGAPTTPQGAVDGTAFLLVSPGETHNLDFLSHVGTSEPQSSVNLTIADGNAEPPNGQTCSGSGCLLQTGTYGPTDDSHSADTFITQANSPAPPSPNYAVPAGGVNAETLEQAFSGATAAGNWLLYIENDTGIPLRVSGGWCIDLTLNTGAATATALSSSAQKAATGQSVALTATVTSGASPVTSGTVTFFDSTAGVALGGPVTLNGSGLAVYTTSAFTEGDHKITATYNGTASFNTSFGTIWQRIDDATAIGAVNDTTWQYCNMGPLAGPSSSTGAFTPNPSNVFVTNFPGTLKSVAVDLNQFSIPEQQVPPQTSALIQAPSGAALDFFSNTGGTVSTAAQGNYIFLDSAGAQVNNSGNIAAGSYQPTSYQPSYASSDSFISSQSGFYNAPSSFSTAAPKGAATLATTFPSGSNPDGTWSLFFNQHIAGTFASGATQGWCVQLAENPPQVTPALPNTSTFTQGQPGASFTVDVSNAGPGSTSDPTLGSAPLTFTDTLNAAFTYSNFSGTGWSCSAAGQTVTCTNDISIAANSAYPQLTIDVKVSNTASGTISNSGTVHGAGVASTSSNIDVITIQPAPSLAVTKTHTGNFTQGQTAEWDIAVTNTVAGSMTYGTTTVVDTLPTGYTLSNASGLGWSCSGAGVATCTSTQGVSGGGSFTTLALIVNVPDNSPVSVSNTASAFGGGDLTHTNAGTAATSNTDTVTVTQVPATVAINGSQTQSAQVGTAFGSLAVTIKDAGGAVIPNDPSVTFTATTAASGATGTFSNSTGSITTAANASGIADPGAFTANLNSGSYAVTVTAGTASTSFNLTNTALTPVISWTPATTVIFGDAGVNVLNATTACSPGCGTFTYTATPGGGSPSAITSTTGLVAGSYTITATFNPSSNGYSTASATSPLTVSGESVWIVNTGGSTAELAGNGYAITSTAYQGANAAVAIDNAGNVWSAGTGSSLLVETSQVGTHPTTIASGTGGLSSPAGIAIDGAGQVWVTNGNNSVSLFTSAGAPLSPSGGFTDPSLSTPAGIAVDLGGSVWIANKGNNSVTRILGAAAPAAPLATAAKNNTTGARP
jgi:hypothetical protein